MGCLEVEKRGLGINVTELYGERFCVRTKDELLKLLDDYNFDFINQFCLTDDPVFDQLSFEEKFYYTFLALGQEDIPESTSVEDILNIDINECDVTDFLSKSFCLLHNMPVDCMQIGADYNGDFYAFFTQFFPFPEKFAKTLQFTRTEFLNWLNEFFDSLLKHNYKPKSKLEVCEFYIKW